eukprot:4651742-Pleurochrysis_carterae.AAC.2
MRCPKASLNSEPSGPRIPKFTGRTAVGASTGLECVSSGVPQRIARERNEAKRRGSTRRK